MYKEIVAFVHAKGTSVRVPSKNLRKLGDRPLFCHSIRNALNSKLVTKVIIDSENDEILELGKEYGAIPLKRPQSLATNFSTGDDLAYWQASNYPESDIVLQVIPTAPFISSSSIDKAIRKLLDNPSVDSIAGVYEEAFYIWKNGVPSYYRKDGTIPNSTEMNRIMYETTGLYINYTKAVLKTKRRLNPNNCIPFMLSKIETIDINTMDDFKFAEIVWKGFQG